MAVANRDGGLSKDYKSRDYEYYSGSTMQAAPRRGRTAGSAHRGGRYLLFRYVSTVMRGVLIANSFPPLPGQNANSTLDALAAV